MLVQEKKTYVVIDTWEDLTQCLNDINTYLDDLEAKGEKKRLAVDTETCLCKESRRLYDLEYSLSKITKRKPELVLMQAPKYPIPRPVKSKWGFYDLRVRLIQIGINPKHMKLQYVIDLFKLYANSTGFKDVFEFYECIGKKIKDTLNRATIIGQNLKYEYGIFWKFFKFRLNTMRDTFLMSQILWMGDKVHHKLSDLYRMYIDKELFRTLIDYKVQTYINEEGEEVIIDDPFGWYADFKEEEQKSPWWNPELTEDQLWYGAQDVYFIWWAFDKLVQELGAWASIHDNGMPGTGVLEIVKLECELIKPIAKAEIIGFQLDIEYWENELEPALRKEIEEAQAEADRLYMRKYTVEKKKTIGRGPNKVIQFYDEEVIEQYNLNSPAQVREILGDEICSELPKTDKGAPSTGADNLFIIKDKHPIVPLVLKTKQALKNIGFFTGERGYLNYADADGIIHHTIHQIGNDEENVDSGRMSESKPNLTQVPGIPKIRRAFIAKKDHKKKYKLIIKDYSQIEPRFAGEDAEDEFLISCFKAKRDLHSETAKHVYRLDFLPDKHNPEHKEWRGRGKVIRLARTYLMGLDKAMKTIYVESNGLLDYLFRGEEGKKELLNDLQAFDAMTPQVSDLREMIEKQVRAKAEYYGGMADPKSGFKNGTPFYVGKSCMGRTRRFCLSPEDRRSVHLEPEEWDIELKVLYEKTQKISTWNNFCNQVLRDAARAAFNGRIQTSCADMFKKGIILYNEELESLADQGIIDEHSVGMINFVHDEIIVQTDEDNAELLDKLLEECMIKATEPFMTLVPVLVEGAAMDSWAEKD